MVSERSDGLDFLEQRRRGARPQRAVWPDDVTSASGLTPKEVAFDARTRYARSAEEPGVWPATVQVNREYLHHISRRTGIPLGS
jgi:hypothetical protein